MKRLLCDQYESIIIAILREMLERQKSPLLNDGFKGGSSSGLKVLLVIMYDRNPSKRSISTLSFSYLKRGSWFERHIHKVMLFKRGKGDNLLPSSSVGCVNECLRVALPPHQGDSDRRWTACVSDSQLHMLHNSEHWFGCQFAMFHTALTDLSETDKVWSILWFVA